MIGRWIPQHAERAGGHTELLYRDCSRRLGFFSAEIWGGQDAPQLPEQQGQEGVVPTQSLGNQQLFTFGA